MQSAKRHHPHYIFHAVFARFLTVTADFHLILAALYAQISAKLKQLTYDAPTVEYTPISTIRTSGS